MKEFVDSKKRKASQSVDLHVEVDNPYLHEVRQLRKTIPTWDTFFTEGDEEEQRNGWVRLDVLGGPLCTKYAWAIPNKRALRIIANFSSIIEIGAGKGYWASLLQQAGVDIICYDKKGQKKDNWTTVEKGGPSVLREKIAKGRTLFLCYPDDSNSMAVKCLDAYDGEYVIHVGELITTGTLSGGSQAPFGRTTGSDFSVALAESFHCLLTASLPNFPFGKDCITVWKRTQFVAGKSQLLGDGEEDGSDSKEGAQQGKGGEEGSEQGSEDEAEEDSWAAIPAEERLPTDRAAPCLAHLLGR